MFVKDERITLTREKPVEFYNGIGLPHFKSKSAKLAYVKPNLIRKKLIIHLWLGDRLDAEMFKQLKRRNDLAVDRARKAEDDEKFSPDDKFWKVHPDYGYRREPILDTGRQSIYMDSDPPGGVVRPLNRSEIQGGGRRLEFYDKIDENECQGFIDGLTTLFKPYPRDP